MVQYEVAEYSSVSYCKPNVVPSDMRRQRKNEYTGYIGILELKRENLKPH